MQNSESQFNVLYSDINSEKHALKVIREATIFFAIIVSIQLLIIIFNSIVYEVLISGVILLILSVFLYKKRSSLAAIILIVLTSIDLILTILFTPKSLGFFGYLK